MTKRTAAGTLALAVCLGGGAIALAGALRADPPSWYHPGPAGLDEHSDQLRATDGSFGR